MSTLVGIGYSPWSAKARWALDHHGVDYTYEAYTPVFGALPLRRRMGKWSGRLTVPVYFDAAGVFDDSLKIARRAEAIGGGAPLFPPAHDAEVVHWNQVGDAIAEAGRALTTYASLNDPAALRASMPRALAKLPGAGAIGRFGARQFIRKYSLRHEPALAELDAALATVDAALSGPTLLPGFSYADIAVAVALQFVKPVDHPSIRLGRAAHAAWTQPALVEKYGRLLAWRDALFAAHR